MRWHIRKCAVLRRRTWSAIVLSLICTFVVARASPVTVKLPADLVYEDSSGAARAVVFSHGTHFGFAGNRCVVCHPRPFRMLRPERRTSHAAMDAGNSCGACHDGRHAFAVRDRASCSICHAGRPAERRATIAGAPAPGAPPAARTPGSHRYPRGESSPGPVTFAHASHLKRGSACAACHPRPFGMRFTPPRAGGGMHEKTACGSCHDGARAFGTGDPAACARCHVPEGGGS